MKVSVICTNYNKGQWLAEAIEGIINQECRFKIELIIVDDASTDDSPEIIKFYQEQYPQLIRAFFNSDNKGITKTWKDICQQATGDYIARCDGDDYWIDPYKLQKQVDALEKSAVSRWCSTDFDVVNENGELTQSAAVASGIIRKMSTFEEELAFKGMTMSSTWLVDRQLMLEATAAISDDAIDDTFNLQLELFMRTEVTFLPDVTTVYRLVDNSDSHSDDFSKMLDRLDRLHQTQLDYLDKHPGLDKQQLLLDLFASVNEREKIMTQKSLELKMTSDYAQLLEHQLQELKSAHEQLQAEKAVLLNDKENLFKENQRVYDVLSEDRDRWFQEYQAIVQSRRWKIPSKIIDFFRGKK